MAGFTSYDDLINEMTVGGKVLDYFFLKIGIAAEAAGCWETFWPRIGITGAGAAPSSTPGMQYSGTQASPVNGAMCFPDETPDQKHIIGLTGLTTVTGTLLVYDRLFGVGAVATGSTGDKALDNGTIGIPRYTNGNGVIPMLEVTVATTSAAVVTLSSYVNQDGDTVVTAPSVTYPAAATDVGTMVFLPLAAGDYGCRNVTTLNVGTSGANSSTCNVCLIKPLAFLPISGLLANERDFVAQLPSLPRVFDGACLALAWFASTTTAMTVHGMLRLAYG